VKVKTEKDLLKQYKGIKSDSDRLTFIAESLAFMLEKDSRKWLVNTE
jgi:hypothetical protein